MSIFDKFDKNYDLVGLGKDVSSWEENGGTTTYEEVPNGEYEVKVSKLELVESKKGDPMVTVWFDILEGDYKNQKIFMNQVITQGFQIGIVNKFLRSLDTKKEIEFKSFNQYANLLMDIQEAIEQNHLEFLLDYGKNKKGFNTFAIKEVFDAVPF